jgi:predicted HicB family RNase H-like nuclease
MKDKMTNKNFIGSVHFSSDDDIFYGKIEGINDLVTFESDNVAGLLASFKEAVDDYLELCEKTKMQVHRSLNGSFNIRITPDMHRLLYEKSQSLGVLLNRVVQKAIEYELKEDR